MCLLACMMQATAQTNFRSLSYDEALDAAKKENKLVFIDFYTSWCGPCLKAMPHVKEMNDKYKHTGKLVVIGVNCDEKAESGKTVVDKNGYDWLQLLSKNGDFDLANEYGI